MDAEPECNHSRGKIVQYGWRGYRWLETCIQCGQPFYVTHRNEIVRLDVGALPPRLDVQTTV